MAARRCSTSSDCGSRSRAAARCCTAWTCGWPRGSASRSSAARARASRCWRGRSSGWRARGRAPTCGRTGSSCSAGTRCGSRSGTGARRAGGTSASCCRTRWGRWTRCAPSGPRWARRSRCAVRAGPATRARVERAERVLAALDEAGLPDPAVRARQRPGELSGGMRQRALIASAVVARPPLLVADEPTTALDATVAARVLGLLGNLRDAGTAVVLVTHDLGAVARVADRVVVLRDGRVVEEGPTARVLGAPREEYTRELVAAARLGEGPGAVPEPGVPVLEGRGLRRVFALPGGESVTAVDGLDVTVRAGEAVGLVGESGSGKTTLARLLLAADTPDAGEVLLDGMPWSALPERDRRALRSGIRLVPQDPLGTVDPRLTVRAVLRAALATGPRPPARADRDAAAAALLARVHLPTEVLDRRPRTLSGGQRQRVAIARALASDPRVLLLDEPVSALDVQVQAAILDLLVELRRDTGVAMVLVSHDLGVVRRVCDRVLVMSGGRVVEQGTVPDVFGAPAHPVTRDLLAARAV
nr:ATP-binding cassette domain-containing protein [Cellulomonas sp. IC4_254]